MLRSGSAATLMEQVVNKPRALVKLTVKREHIWIWNGLMWTSRSLQTQFLLVLMLKMLTSTVSYIEYFIVYFVGYVIPDLSNDLAVVLLS